jgi:hypothetical protein
MVNLAGAEAGPGHLQVSLGRFDRGYEMLEVAMAKAEALGLSAENNRAHMAELALKQGDLERARRHLRACSSHGTVGMDARAALTRRAGCPVGAS